MHLFSLSVMVCLACAASLPVHVQATIYSADNCAPCARYVDAVRKELPKRGLIVRDDFAKDADQADIVITKKPVDGIDGFPTTIVRKNGREVKRIVGEMNPLKLAEILDK
jgi:hypothetical protein